MREALEGNTITLTIANRDTEGYCFKVEIEKANCRWNFLDIDEGKNISETDEKFCHLIHSERTPSLKPYHDHIHCFGCGKSGDVIAIVALRLNISQFDSAKVLTNDFHLSHEEFKLHAILLTK